jgi:lipoate-protein ligase A
LETILGKRLTWEEAATAFTQAFLEYFQEPVKQSDLLPFEFTLAQEIYRSKYSTASWNERI